MSAVPPPAGAETPFLGDPVGLDLLKGAVQRHLPSLSADRPFRVWVPQCSTGADAYSVAIGLIEAMGSRWREIPLRVFSTDSDDGSLARARAARYPFDACREIPRDTFERFFVRESHGVQVRPFVRDVCRFVRHDLSQPPPSRGLT